VSNLTLYFTKHMSRSMQSYKMKKILIKQSYLLIAWYKYISKEGSSSSIFTLPVSSSKLTLTKSPMAHKTFSQEQFSFTYYNLLTKSISFLPASGVDFNNALVVLSLFKFSSRQSGTNLLFASRLRFEFPVKFSNSLTY